jgi:hypothetical protein
VGSPPGPRANLSEFDAVRAEVSKHERLGGGLVCSPFDTLVASGAAEGG